MSDQSRIEWCDATWNPVVGCTRVSEGCRNCYAVRLAHRFGSNPATPQYKGLTEMTPRGPEWSGWVKLVESAIEQPLRWKRPRRIFVCSMGDLFHPGVPDEALDRVFAAMALCPQHTFMVLTKRPERMRGYITDACRRVGSIVLAKRTDDIPLIPLSYGRPGSEWWPLPNVWLGVTAEDQARADERIPVLLATPAAKRFVSIEPMLGPVDCGELLAPPEMTGVSGGGLHEYVAGPPLVDWVICGGETGPNARPMHPEWARSLRDQCVGAGVPFFFKQWGEWGPGEPLGAEKAVCITPTGFTFSPDAAAFNAQAWPDGAVCFSRVGKHRAGRLLDGRAWEQFPEDRV